MARKSKVLNPINNAAAAFKSIGACVSRDATRYNLAHVEVTRGDNGVTFTATDGYTLASATYATDAIPPDLVAGLYLPKKAAALLSSGIVPSPSPDAATFKFPYWRQVIPSDIRENVAATAAVNPAFLSRVADVLAAVCGTDGGVANAVRLVSTGNVSPIVLEAPQFDADKACRCRNGVVHAVGVVMPVRQ